MIEQLFRTNEAAQSTVYGVLLATLASFFLSFLLVLTYRLTSREVIERREFMQGMALISMVATMIMQAIGDSLARGLGMLGALSIIRFRTSLTSPRNMAFMFASLAAGIACGVFGFTIAFIGTTAFCVVAAALSFEFRGDAALTRGELRLVIDTALATEPEIRRVVANYTKRLELAEKRYNLPKPPPPPRPTPAGLPAEREHGNGHENGNGSSSRHESETSNRGTATAVAVRPAPAPIDVATPETLQQVLIYHLRMRPKASEADLFREMLGHPAVIDQRLRFSKSQESL